MNFHPDDRPPATDQPIRARVPDHVAAGAFSTGVIVMTANTEFILDFVQNLGRPHQIIARVVMPHHVLPQLIDALQRNIDLYRKRWGELPQMGAPSVSQLPWTQQPSGDVPGTGQHIVGGPQQVSLDPPSAGSNGGGGSSAAGGAAASSESTPGGVDPNGSRKPEAGGAEFPGDSSQAGGAPEQGGFQGRQTTAQDIYDDLKIRDEILSGSYSNAVMIGHGPHEFSFDFITNFYPHSSVSARVFLAAGQIPRLFDSLRGTWEQLRARQSQQPPGNQPPGFQSPGSQNPGSNPSGGDQPKNPPSDSGDEFDDPIA